MAVPKKYAWSAWASMFGMQDEFDAELRAADLEVKTSTTLS
jgi:hypothetical protein